MNPKLSSIITVILLMATFCLFTTPIEDGDCFWHIATGQWIWDHKALPDTDPFTHTFSQQTSASSDANITGFILNQYWLGQLAFATLWKTAGSAGIVVFRALTYSAILAFLYTWLRKRNSVPFSLLMVLPLAFILRSYPNERPQLFTFLLMPLVLWLLEDLREAGRPKILHWLALPLTMLIWANCHGGYILGVLFILMYLVTIYLEPSKCEIACKGASAAVMIAALATSFLNPNGMGAFREIFKMQSSAGGIQEFLSPLRAAWELHLWFPPYWLFMVLLVFTVVTRFKEIHLQHLLILILLAILSLTSLRYMPFLLMAGPILARYLPVIQPDRITWGSALTCCSLFLLSADWRECFAFSPDRFFPASAVRFLSATVPAPELFNYYDWGGYILLHSPGMKTFTDGRALSSVVNKDYDDALWTNRWQEIFARYRINSVIIPGASKSTGATFPLALNLLNSNDWLLVYRDTVALIYIRNIPENSSITNRYALDRRELQRHILKLLDIVPAGAQKRVEFWVSRGNAQMLLQDYPSAKSSFQKALTIDPGNQWAAMMFRQTGRR